MYTCTTFTVLECTVVYKYSLLIVLVCIRSQVSVCLVVEVDSTAVVPLDTLLVPRDAHRYRLCADCVLLSGSAFVDESMLTGKYVFGCSWFRSMATSSRVLYRRAAPLRFSLTGESLPVSKSPLPASGSSAFGVRDAARHVLYAGTLVLQTRSESPGDGDARALVVRTGFASARGELLRAMLHPKPLDFVYERHAWYLAGALALLGLAGVAYALFVEVCCAVLQPSGGVRGRYESDSLMPCFPDCASPESILLS